MHKIIPFLFLAATMVGSLAIHSPLAHAFQAGQATFPRPDYYAAYNLLKDGRTDKANDAMRIVLRPYNIPVEQRGLESIPGMVMLGECYYHEGDLMSALEQYDAALKVSIRSAGWLSSLKPHPLPSEKFEGVRGVSWLASQRKSKLANLPRHWQVATNAPGVVILPGGEKPIPGSIVTLDAIEILRTQAIALRRRSQILGAIASQLPFTHDIQNAFSVNFQELDPVLMASSKICQALAELPTAANDQVVAKIQAASMLPNGSDHPLTPIALLVLGDIAAWRGDFPNAGLFYGEASLIAAHLEYLDWVAEATMKLGSVASVARDARMLPVLQQIAGWGKNKSLFVLAAALCQIADMQVSMGDFHSVPVSLQQLKTVLAPDDVVLPRMEAFGFWIGARTSFGLGNIPEGTEQLMNAIKKFDRDDPPMSACTPVFQCQLLQKMVKSGDWNVGVVMHAVPILIQDNIPANWMLEPVESLCFAKYDKKLLLDLWLDAETKQGDANSVAYAIDWRERYRFHASEPLGGRLTSVRRLYLIDPRYLAPSAAVNVRTWSGIFPELERSAFALKEIEQKIKGSKPNFDTRQWQEEDRKLADSMGTLSSKMESMFWFAATSRYALAIAFPKPLDLAALRESTSADEGVLAFYRVSDSYYGWYASGERTEKWRVGTINEVQMRIVALLEEIGVAKHAPLASDAVKTDAWKTSAAAFEKSLVPPAVAASLGQVQKLHIVPDGSLWYFPFEILPCRDNKDGQRWMGQHRIVYAPTIGQSLPYAAETPIAAKTVGLSTAGFFSEDAPSDLAEIDRVVKAVPCSEIRTGQTGAKWQPSRWARARANRVWVAGRISIHDVTSLAPLGYDHGAEDGTLSSWLKTPYTTPSEIAIIGLETPVALGQVGDGSELFELSCVLAATGNHSALISRWPVRGSSSSQLLANYLASLSSEPASAAWQRAVLELWEQNIPTTSEPILAAKNTDPLTVKGSLPLLWSGYMQMGDTTGVGRNPK